MALVTGGRRFGSAHFRISANSTRRGNFYIFSIQSTLKSISICLTAFSVVGLLLRRKTFFFLFATIFGFKKGLKRLTFVNFCQFLFTASLFAWFYHNLFKTSSHFIWRQWFRSLLLALLSVASFGSSQASIHGIYSVSGQFTPVQFTPVQFTP